MGATLAGSSSQGSLSPRTTFIRQCRVRPFRAAQSSGARSPLTAAQDDLGAQREIFHQHVVTVSISPWHSLLTCRPVRRQGTAPRASGQMLPPAWEAQITSTPIYD